MFRPLSASIGLRYLRAKRRNGFISFISLASILGIALGVMALIATLAVRSGFREEFVNTILGANAHVTVFADRIDDAGRIDRTIPDYLPLAERIGAVPGVIHASPQIRGQVMANANGRNAGVEVASNSYEGVTHEFFGAAPVVEKAKEAQAYVAGRLREAFVGGSAGSGS